MPMRWTRQRARNTVNGCGTWSIESKGAWYFVRSLQRLLRRVMCVGGSGRGTGVAWSWFSMVWLVLRASLCSATRGATDSVATVTVTVTRAAPGLRRLFGKGNVGTEHNMSTVEGKVLGSIASIRKQEIERKLTSRRTWGILMNHPLVGV